jgi:hypothetical protein
MKWSYNDFGLSTVISASRKRATILALSSTINLLSLRWLWHHTSYICAQLQGPRPGSAPIWRRFESHSLNTRCLQCIMMRACIV